MHELEPISPVEAVDMYCAERASELTKNSLNQNKYQLNNFIRWCDDEGIENLNNLTGRDIHRFKLSRQNEGVSNSAIMNQLYALRTFIKFCEGIEAVNERLHEKIVVPRETDDDRRTVMVSKDEADEILSYLSRYRYASRIHGIFQILWHTAIRTGSLMSLDKDDYDSDNQSLVLEHRPSTGTTLKNGTNGERIVSLNDTTCRVIEDYIEVNRIDKEDEYGRSPLFTTENGRITRNTVRRNIYAVSKPCIYSGNCPHGREKEDCEATDNLGKSRLCPSSKSGHPIRRGSITHHLKSDVPEKAVSDRCDVSSKILDRHYDQRTDSEKMEQRRQFLDSI